MTNVIPLSYSPAVAEHLRDIGVMPPTGKLAGRDKCDRCGRPVVFYGPPVFCRRLLCRPCTERIENE